METLAGREEAVSGSEREITTADGQSNTVEIGDMSD